MGGPSSGGSDNNVSGNEAVYTGGKTYSSKKTKTVNKEIADQNKANRDSRKGLAEKIFEKTLLGQVANKVSNSKFVQDSNYKRRVAFAKKSGKFTDTDLNSREFVLSSGFKNQLDGLGYSKKDARTGEGGPEETKSIEQPKVASQMDNSEVKSDLITADKTAPTSVEMTQDEINVANKRGKKTKTILTSVVGDKSNATLSKKALLG
jgi:hypothetical protein